MSLLQIYEQFIADIQNTRWYEYIAVFTGIASVWYSRKENILVYPVGLINTIIYIYISVKGNLFGEAGVNFYYTVMSIIGWYMWLKKDTKKEITDLNQSEERIDPNDESAVDKENNLKLQQENFLQSKIKSVSQWLFRPLTVWMQF